MNQEQLRKEAAVKYAKRFTSPRAQLLAAADFTAGIEWEAEREKSISIEDAKQYAWEWINKKDLLDVVLDHEDIWLLMADFANTNPTKNK